VSLEQVAFEVELVGNFEGLAKNETEIVKVFVLPQTEK